LAEARQMDMMMVNAWRPFSRPGERASVSRLYTYEVCNGGEE
jgi:hypothetical protein